MTSIRNRESAWRSWRLVAAALLGISLLTSIALFNPHMPGVGLDPSWATTANVASASHLAFGQDLINTFGPYNALFSRTYHPGIDTLMLAASLLLMLAYYLLALIAFSGRTGAGYLLAAAFFALASIDQNAIFFAYPLLFATAIHRLPELDQSPAPAWTQRALSTGVVVAGAIGNGMLGLSKASMIPYSLVILTVCAVWLALQGKRLLAVGIVLAYLAATALLWLAAGQSISHLANYYLSIVPVISGYGDAMSYPGPALQWIAYLAIAATTLFVLVTDRARSRRDRVFLGLAIAACYFFAFKAGFVRHDGLVHNGFPVFFSGHAATAALMLMIVGFLSPALVGSRVRQAVAGTLGVLGCAFIIGAYGPVNPYVAGKHVLAVQVSALAGIGSRMDSGDTFESRYKERIAQIRNELDIPAIDGGFDLYSYDQAYLLAHPLQWRPRPASQGYAAYTPELSRINVSHLQTTAAPSNIIFKVQTIDGRYPSLDDGASWPLLMRAYSPTKRLQQDFLLLERNQLLEGSPELSPPTYAPEQTIRLGQRVQLPAGEDNRYVRFRFHKTLIGRAQSVVYKTPILIMQVELADGNKAMYRLVPGMAEAGFLLSPLIDSSDKFAFAATRQLGPLAPSKVTAFTLGTVQGGGLAWQDQVHYSLSAPY